MNVDDQGQAAVSSLNPSQAPEGSAPTVKLPSVAGSLPHSVAHGQTLRIEGTNVVRVPFGVRRPRRTRPERPERWATLVIPFQAGGSTPPPPQAA